MRSLKLVITLVSTMALATSLVACGGDDDGGDDISVVDSGPTADAPQAADAPMSTPDSGAAAAEGLGEVCDPMNNMCPQGAPDCAILSQQATNGFCTLSCGEGDPPANPNDQPTPPTDGNQVCTTAYTGTEGTPACVLYGAEMNGMIPWSCGILCGNVQGTELGGCPGGLTCTQNICQ